MNYEYDVTGEAKRYHNYGVVPGECHHLSLGYLEAKEFENIWLSYLSP
jgi:hypothetical protein